MFTWEKLLYLISLMKMVSVDVKQLTRRRKRRWKRRITTTMFGSCLEQGQIADSIVDIDCLLTF